MSHFTRQPQVGPAVVHYGNEKATLHKPGCAHTARKANTDAVEAEVLAQDRYGDDFFEVAPCLVDKKGTMPVCHGRWVCNTVDCEGDR